MLLQTILGCLIVRHYTCVVSHRLIFAFYKVLKMALLFPLCKQLDNQIPCSQANGFIYSFIELYRTDGL